MKLRSSQGGFITVGEERGKRLLQSSEYTLIEELPQKAPEPSEEESKGKDTQEPVLDAPALPQAPEEAKSERPDVATVRAWAKENDIPVSDKGRVSGDVYDKYAEAHRN